MVVDDEVDSLELVELSLVASGAIALGVSCAANALEVIEQFKPDILISDIAMPQADGSTLLNRIRGMKQVGQIPAIAPYSFCQRRRHQKLSLYWVWSSFNQACRTNGIS